MSDDRTGLSARLGHAVPGQVAAYYRNLDAGRVADTVACFSPDARYAVPGALPGHGASERAPRLVLTGSVALEHAFGAQGVSGYLHDVHTCLVQGDRVFVEGVARSAHTGEAAMSFGASIRLDPAGRIERYLAFGRLELPAAPEPSPAVAVDGAQVLDQVVAAVAAGPEAAVGLFAPDAEVLLPPAQDAPGSTPRRANGVEEIREALDAGGIPTGRVVGHACDGPVTMAELLDEGGTSPGSVWVSLTVDGDGLVRRLLAFACSLSIP